MNYWYVGTINGTYGLRKFLTMKKAINNFLQRSIVSSHTNILGQHNYVTIASQVSRTISPTVDVHIPSPNNPAIVCYSTLVASLQTMTHNLASTLFGCLNLVVCLSRDRSCGKNGPLLTNLSFSKGLGLGCGFLVSSFHTIPRYSLRSSQII